jgi:hypothetical protein
MFDLYPRKKTIHGQGCVAKVRFTPRETSKYSGILGSGSRFGVMRMSVTKPFTDQVKSLSPGIAFKFFRNGKPSANILANYSVEGIDGFNFFKHDFSINTPSVTKDSLTVGKIPLIARFFLISAFPSLLGISNVRIW